MTIILENGIKCVEEFTGETFTSKKYIVASTGKKYEVPEGMDVQKYYELMQGVCSLIKEKETTIKQAQKLCLDCSEMILEMKYN